VETIESLRTQRSDAILFECVSGSHAYGTATDASDEDIRGIYAVPAQAYLSLCAPEPQLSDARGDTVYFSLRRCIELLSVANPNLLELLYMPPDCVRKTTPEMEALLASRDLFITRQCADTHVGYAMSQIKKARGQNKWVNNPKSESPPTREEFCFVIPRDSIAGSTVAPSRPVALAKIGWNLERYHAARLEHARDTYRMYDYGAAARGVFRGEALVCESIPLNDEAERFAGLLLFNEQAYEQSKADHQNYWRWRRERNDARWEAQESGQLDFDAKNLMHTVRLLMSGRSILQIGTPLVRFEGEALQLLRNIREGRMSFDEIMTLAQAIMAECEELKTRSSLPTQCDPAAADQLLAKLTRQWEARQ
jgi:uncharacterized protein